MAPSDLIWSSQRPEWHRSNVAEECHRSVMKAGRSSSPLGHQDTNQSFPY
jgi:hypothetical protein